MIPQERRFTLAEVHTKVGPMGQVQLDQGFLEVLGVSPGDSISFSIDEQGNVTVKGFKKEQQFPPRPGATNIKAQGNSITAKPGDVTQAVLFGTDVPAPRTRKSRSRRR